MSSTYFSKLKIQVFKFNERSRDSLHKLQNFKNFKFLLKK